MVLDLDVDHEVDSIVTLWPPSFEKHPRRYLLQTMDDVDGTWHTQASVQMHKINGELPNRNDFGYGTVCGLVNISLLQ